MMDSTWPKTSLSDFKSTPFTKQHIGCRYPDIILMDFRMPLRCIVVAEHGQRPFNFDTWKIEWHKDHRLLLVFRCIRSRFTHDGRYFTARVHRARRPPF